MPAATDGLFAVMKLEHPTDLRLTLAPLCRGQGDPTFTRNVSGFWRATRTPQGPGTQCIRAIDAQTIHVSSWGPGAAWLLRHAPELVGANDDHGDFPHVNKQVSELHKQYERLRTPRTLAVFEAVFPTIIEQKVTGREAKHSYARLSRYFGELAPGPGTGGPQLLLPPDPRKVEQAPSHVFHEAGVERKRSDAIRQAASSAHHFEKAATEGDSVQVKRLLATVPGIGPWSIAEVAQIALGDSNAVSVGDFHLKNWVSWNLSGRPRGTDEEMVDLLRPFAPFRGRVVKLLQLGGAPPPKYGPRLKVQKRW
jgi:3-methyladenine DNA glycosylase/8-oxoguanine DNA glycosylase